RRRPGRHPGSGHPSSPEHGPAGRARTLRRHRLRRHLGRRPGTHLPGPVPRRCRRRSPPLQRPRRAPGRLSDRKCVMTSTFDPAQGVVSTGVSIFADALTDQAVDVSRVDWRPPMEGTAADLATLATDPLRAEANAKALAAYLGVQGDLVGLA